MASTNTAPPPLRNLFVDEAFNEHARYFQEFLDLDYGENIYKEKIRRMLLSGERRLVVNINDIRMHRREYADGLLSAPMDYLPPFDKALKDVVLSLSAGQPGKYTNQSFSVGLEGSFGDNLVSPRQVNASYLGKLIAIEGIVTRCSLVRPKVARSVHYCEKTQVFHSREYRDLTSLSSTVATPAVYPTTDEEGNPLTTEFGLSTYNDYQTCSLQEMPERAPAGQLPRPLDVILDEDLVDKVKPGDRVRIIGSYRSVGKAGGSSSATFRTIIIANNVCQLGKEIQQPSISEDDIRHIKAVSSKDNVFELLSASLAPSIFGHDYIKKSILLFLMGGIEKNLPGGTHIRGDINMLLIGDPSTAKSQMLRFVLNIAPLAIATTGRGSSGVGLTAAVTHDKETGERRLEAGAMVLADRGVICIDEFDKMSDIDRVAIHEVMEQQTVTIAKAGIHTSLNARCSVIAAANPAFGQYIDAKKPFENIPLPDSLLSRFDLLFVVLDDMNDDHNRRISEHIIRLHRYTPPGLEEGAPISDTVQFVYEKYNPLLHVGVQQHKEPATPGKSRRKAGRKSRQGGADDAEPRVELLSLPFMKKYIHYAKTRVKPVLSEGAANIISETYSQLRDKRDDNQYRTMPITPRTLETLIRLATAHAKCRLSTVVEEGDAEVAKEILEYALYKIVKEPESDPRKKRRRRNEGAVPQAPQDSDQETGDEDAGEDEDDGDSDDGAHRTPRLPAVFLPAGSSRGRTRTTSASQHTAHTFGASSSSQSSRTLQNTLTSSLGAMELDDTPSGALVSDELFNIFRGRLHQVREAFTSEGSDTVMTHDIITRVNAGLPGSKKFSVDEAKAILRKMSDDNLLWYQEGAEQVTFI
ncbi:MCM2/3/5 family-domain-containing protein [Polychytrium aggregatum]|uniref:MCM2/3/5 family-domain-containing protein n=1 Tax=Polychytrium aggregatum TaxID=110093 RepID=UPI0022FF1867|nr:MCM2/3/5 family-domain-containing protein [Polychytrium aggregatum]KAI9204443.1 MCM2/3/5 family-domain-containing protein [Polychytrium aggregatum]